jgi:hypothetical protein
VRERERLWREFFSDPSQWWDYKPEKVTEYQSCQGSHVNAALALVGVNLVALSLIAILSWSRLWQEFFSVSLHWRDSSSRLEKVSKMQFAVAKLSC